MIAGARCFVQVVKEEWATRARRLPPICRLQPGAIALMPNTARGGGISCKITDSTDRRRLKEVARDIEVPEGAAYQLRTAGAQRTKAEIKRFRLSHPPWENVRDLTLPESVAPVCLVEGRKPDQALHGFGDLYTCWDVDEVLVEGDDDIACQGLHEDAHAEPCAQREGL